MEVICIRRINGLFSVTGAGSSTNLHAGGTNCAAVLTDRVECVISERHFSIGAIVVFGRTDPYLGFFSLSYPF